jgi:microcystin-dependent protein
MTLQQDINRLKSYFLSKDGGILQGEVTPDVDEAYNLGREDKKWQTIYANTVIAENLQTGEGGVGNADTVDTYHASQSPFANYLLALSPQGVFPVTVIPTALLKDGSRALEDDLAVIAGATVDLVDISEHIHTGSGASGEQLTHTNLLGLDADDHPQYTQRAQDEIITGDWAFTSLQDRTAGWQFLPDTYQFKALSGNMLFTTSVSPDTAKIELGANDEIVLYDDDTPNTYIKVGLGNNSVTFSGTDATYRLWAGHADGASAPFSVEADGSIYSIDGLIGGWTIDSDSISQNDLDLQSVGRIIAGTGDDIIQLDSQDPTWRIWAGNAVAADALFRVNKFGQVYVGDGFVTGTLKSTNFISGQQGFSLDSSGLAEFDEIIARGRLQAVVFAEASISVASGKLMITDGSVLAEEMPDTQDYFVVDNPVFQPNDIVRLKPDAFRDEWMRVASPYEVVENGFKYFVVRELNSGEPTWAGPYDFYSGESIARHGSAVQTSLAYPLASGEAGGEYGEYQPGGSGASTSGGYLILEGSRNFGPFFGVAARYGPVYDQVLDVVRVGNLNGVLDYTEEEWGAIFGDANQFFAYDQTQGLRIEFSGTDVDSSIDASGMKSEVFRFAKNTSDPAYANFEAKMYYKNTGTPELKVRYKEDALEEEFVISPAAAWPVGSVYIAVVSTNPATLLGFGTWEAFATGRTIVGIDGAQSEFDTVEETGGAKTHTLLENEMPSHTHVQNSHNHTQNQHRHTDGNHSHTISHDHLIWNTDKFSGSAAGGVGGKMDSAGTWGGIITGPTRTASSGNAAITTNYTTPTNVAATAVNQDTGGDDPHNNLPPYIVVYMWKRTA